MMMNKKIFYGVAGEGFGHALRANSLIENLSAEIHIFTWGDAYSFFKKRNYPYLHEICGIPFGRNKSGKISYLKSVYSFFKFLYNYNSSFNYILNLSDDVDLFISDFEPIIPRIARHIGVPLLSIDNQHKFSRCTKSLNYKFHSWLMGRFTEYLIPDPAHVIISTFYHNVLLPIDDSTLTNCFMRKNFDQHVIEDDNFILVYYKASCGDKILEILSEFPYKVKVYNCPKKVYSQFEYYEMSDDAFVADLVKCKYIFCASGNQLLGEAIYCGKPIFTVPEPNQPEQIINSFYIEYLNVGMRCFLEDLNKEKIEDFFTRRWDKKSSLNGVHVAAKVVRDYLK